MQSPSDGFKLFLWTSLSLAPNKSTIQMSEVQRNITWTPLWSLCTGKKETKPEPSTDPNADGYTEKKPK